MRKAWTAILLGTVMLAACSDSSPRLTNEEEQVLDAMTFLFSGLEDNTKDREGDPDRWRREVRGRSIEFSKLGSTVGIGSSDEDMNRKLRQSKYVRHLERISLEGPCEFYFEEIDQLSKGDSREDFSSDSSKNLLNTLRVNLANAPSMWWPGER
jgi:hypothetical protein